MTTQRQRIISAVYRLHTTTGEDQHRAFDRLCQLADFPTAFEAWLQTKPHPAAVERVVNDVLLVSPMRTMIKAVKTANDFKQSMTMLQRQAGQAAVSLAPLSDGILKLAEEE